MINLNLYEITIICDDDFEICCNIYSTLAVAAKSKAKSIFSYLIYKHQGIKSISATIVNEAVFEEV